MNQEHPCNGCEYAEECPAANCCMRFRNWAAGRPWEDVKGLGVIEDEVD